MMETFIIPTICLVPSLAYLSMAVFVAVSCRRDALQNEKTVLLIRRDYAVFLFVVALCFVSGIFIYLWGTDRDVYAVLDQTVLKLYLMSTAVPCMLMRRTIFNSRTWVRFYVFAAFAVSLILISDVLVYAGHSLLSRNILCRGAVVVNVLVFLLCIRYGARQSLKGGAENSRELGRELIMHAMVLAIYNSLFLMYSFHLHPVLDYLVLAVGFAVVHSFTVFAVYQKKSMVASIFNLPDAVPEVAVPVVQEERRTDIGIQPAVRESLKERLLGYFETEKPYLSKTLSMEEVAMRLYTNKTYLSKTINVEMNKNFRELVNYFRVKEAIRIFHDDNGISMSELRERCGFNNNASFTSAFKLNTGYTPGEWCRDVRNNKEMLTNGNE